MSYVHFAGGNTHSAGNAGHQVKNNVFYKLQDKAGDCSMPLYLDLDMKKKKPNPNPKNRSVVCAGARHKHLLNYTNTPIISRETNLISHSPPVK